MKHSIIKKTGYLLTAVLFLFCCTSEKESFWRDVEKEEIQSFFKFKSSQSRTKSFTTDLIQVVINTLCKQGDLLDAIRTYRSKYGIPMWEHSKGIATSDGFQLFVPVFNENNPKEIRTIWYFGIYNQTLYHFTRNRPLSDDILEEYWRYDYFTTYALGEKPKNGLIFKSKVNSRAESDDCDDVFVELYYEDPYTGENYYYQDYKGTICWDTPGVGDYKENDPISNEDGFDSEVPADTIESSGGHSDNNNNSSSVAPMAQSIFRNSNMIDENWKVIERMIEKITATCMGQNLYNGLKQKLNGNTLTVQFVDDESSSFHFDDNTNVSGIKLSAINMESNHLMHEMFHAFQAYQETKESYGDATINLEIEAHYAQYLYLKGLPEYLDSDWELDYHKSERLACMLDLELYVNKYGELKDEIFKDLVELRFEVASNVFKNDSIYSKYSYNSNRTGIENFTNLQTLTINCKK